jgi:hypothetical protein
MQAKTTERTMRDLFDQLQRRGEHDAAAGVYLAAKALYLPGPAWRFRPETTIALVHLRAADRRVMA